MRACAVGRATVYDACIVGGFSLLSCWEAFLCGAGKFYWDKERRTFRKTHSVITPGMENVFHIIAKVDFCVNRIIRVSYRELEMAIIDRLQPAHKPVIGEFGQAWGLSPTRSNSIGSSRVGARGLTARFVHLQSNPVPLRVPANPLTRRNQNNPKRCDYVEFNLHEDALRSPRLLLSSLSTLPRSCPYTILWPPSSCLP